MEAYGNTTALFSIRLNRQTVIPNAAILINIGVQRDFNSTRESPGALPRQAR